MFMEIAVMCYRPYVTYTFKASREGFFHVNAPVHFENMSSSEEVGTASFSSDGEPI